MIFHCFLCVCANILKFSTLECVHEAQKFCQKIAVDVKIPSFLYMIPLCLCTVFFAMRIMLLIETVPRPPIQSQRGERGHSTKLHSYTKISAWEGEG